MKASGFMLGLAAALLKRGDYVPALLACIVALVMLANQLPAPECGQNCRQGRRACSCNGRAS